MLCLSKRILSFQCCDSVGNLNFRTSLLTDKMTVIRKIISSIIIIICYNDNEDPKLDSEYLLSNYIKLFRDIFHKRLGKFVYNNM